MDVRLLYAGTQEAIAAAGGVAALGQLLHRGLCNRENGGITEMAAWALQKLAFGHRTIQMEVLRSGTLAQLVESLGSALGDAAAEKVAELFAPSEIVTQCVH
jgi:hypothetical protein